MEEGEAHGTRAAWQGTDGSEPPPPPAWVAKHQASRAGWGTWRCPEAAAP